jgi:hypothetical protein
MSQNQDPLLRHYVEASLTHRARLFRIGGWASIVSSGIFAPAFFAPVQPGEENIPYGLFAFAVLLVVMGVLVLRAATSHGVRIRELVYAKPHEIASIRVLIIQSRNGIRIPTVRIVDNNGKNFGLIMPDAASAKQVVERTLLRPG